MAKDCSKNHGCHALDDDKYCWSCGEELEEVRPCPYCDRPLAAADKFCPRCGRELKAEAAHG
jgi:predicted amidophosphoribosyltransferase